LSRAVAQGIVFAAFLVFASLICAALGLAAFWLLARLPIYGGSEFDGACAAYARQIRELRAR